MILVIDLNQKRNPFGFSEFVAPIASVVKPLEKCRVAHFTEVSGKNAGRYDKIILSGVALMDFAATDSPGKFAWLREYGSPVLGICAGMQVIGQVFGSRLTECKETGMTRIRTVARNPLFSSFFEAYSLHGRGVRPSSVFEVLAKSQKCIESIKHMERDIYGVMFHPEVRNQEIIRNFVSL